MSRAFVRVATPSAVTDVNQEVLSAIRLKTALALRALSINSQLYYLER